LVSPYVRHLQTFKFPDLPSDLDKTFVSKAKDKMELELHRKFRADNKTKIAKVERFLAKFKDGTVHPEMNNRETWYAAKLLLADLRLNGKKEASL